MTARQWGVGWQDGMLSRQPSWSQMLLPLAGLCFLISPSEYKSPEERTQRVVLEVTDNDFSLPPSNKNVPNKESCSSKVTELSALTSEPAGVRQLPVQIPAGIWIMML